MALLELSILLLLTDRFINTLSAIANNVVISSSAAASSSSTTTTTATKISQIQQHHQQHNNNHHPFLDVVVKFFSETIGIAFIHPNTNNNIINNDDDTVVYYDNKPANNPWWMTTIPNLSTTTNTNTNSNTTVGRVIVVAMVVSCMANTCYFTTMLAPIYQRIISNHAFSTEVLMCMLLLLFCLESLVVLSFFILGCNAFWMTNHHHDDDMVVSSTTTTASTTISMTTTNAGTIFHSAVDEFNANGDIDDSTDSNATVQLNFMLIICTILWVFCIMTSNIVRMALYHLLGE
jgi:hypothetical protein